MAAVNHQRFVYNVAISDMRRRTTKRGGPQKVLFFFTQIHRCCIKIVCKTMLVVHFCNVKGYLGFPIRVFISGMNLMAALTCNLCARLKVLYS